VTRAQNSVRLADYMTAPDLPRKLGLMIPPEFLGRIEARRRGILSSYDDALL
jgi:hypothetical protein